MPFWTDWVVSGGSVCKGKPSMTPKTVWTALMTLPLFVLSENSHKFSGLFASDPWIRTLEEEIGLSVQVLDSMQEDELPISSLLMADAGPPLPVLCPQGNAGKPFVSPLVP